MINPFSPDPQAEGIEQVLALLSKDASQADGEQVLTLLSKDAPEPIEQLNFYVIAEPACPLVYVLISAFCFGCLLVLFARRQPAPIVVQAEAVERVGECKA